MPINVNVAGVHVCKCKSDQSLQITMCSLLYKQQIDVSISNRFLLFHLKCDADFFSCPVDYCAHWLVNFIVSFIFSVWFDVLKRKCLHNNTRRFMIQVKEFAIEEDEKKHVKTEYNFLAGFCWRQIHHKAKTSYFRWFNITIQARNVMRKLFTAWMEYNFALMEFWDFNPCKHVWMPFCNAAHSTHLYIIEILIHKLRMRVFSSMFIKYEFVLISIMCTFNNSSQHKVKKLIKNSISCAFEKTTWKILYFLLFFPAFFCSSVGVNECCCCCRKFVANIYGIKYSSFFSAFVQIQCKRIYTASTASWWTNDW